MTDKGKSDFFQGMSKLNGTFFECLSVKIKEKDYGCLKRITNKKRYFTGICRRIPGSFPAGVIGSTLKNLKASAEGEKYEHTTMYPDFAKTARDEGFDCHDF